MQNLKALLTESLNFRKVVFTGKYSQLVIMNLKVNEEIGAEVHDSVDQLFFILDGECEAIIDNKSYKFSSHDVIVIPSGENHNIKNIGKKELKMFTVYSPPQHPKGTVHVTKEDALQAEHH